MKLRFFFNIIFYLHIILVFSFFELPLYSQSLAIIDVDTNNFPVTKAKFYAYDSESTLLRGIDKNRIKIFENGIERKVISVTCPEVERNIVLSSILTIDISSSMLRGAPNIAIAKEAAKAWIESLPSGSECALTSFNQKSYINVDITNEKSILLNAIDTLKPKGGTDYKEAFLNEYSGSISIAKKGVNKRVIVFLTDGQANVNESIVLESALKNKIVIFCVTLGMKMPEVLKNIARKTGGISIENVKSFEQAKDAYLQILEIAKTSGPCEMEWLSGFDCLEERKIDISIPDLNIKTDYKYYSSIKGLQNLDIKPPFISLREGIISGEAEFEISSPNNDLFINDIINIDNNKDFQIEKIRFPLRLNKAERKKIKIYYSSEKQKYSSTKFLIVAEGCDKKTLFISSGQNYKPEIKHELKVTSPNGGEKYDAGNNEKITWEGNIRPVNIEFSSDEGKSWKTLIENFSGNSFNWIPPAINSDKCIIKISETSEENNIITLKGHTRSIKDLSFNPRGDKILTLSEDGTIRLWDAYSGKEVSVLKIIPSENSGRSTIHFSDASFSPDGKFILTSSNDGGLRLWDPEKSEIIATISLSKSNNYFELPVIAKYCNNGKNIVSYFSNGNVFILNSNTLEIISKNKIGKSIDYVGLSIDGKRIVFVDNKTEYIARVINAESGEVINSFEIKDEKRINKAVLDYEGKTLGLLDYFGNIWIFDVNTKNQISFIEGDRAKNNLIRSSSNVLAFSPDGSKVITTPDGVITVYNIIDGKVWKTLGSHSIIDNRGRKSVNYMVTGICFNADGSKLLSTGYDNFTRLWDLSEDKEIGAFKTGSLKKAVMNNMSTRIAFPSSQNQAMILDIFATEKSFDLSDSLWSIQIPKIDIVESDSSENIITEKINDVTTFRNIIIPNAIIPEKGKAFISNYDILGIIGGYSFTNNFMVFAGGVLPILKIISDNQYYAYTLGIKTGLPLSEKINGAIGFNIGESNSDKENTSANDSKIKFRIPYVALSYGDDDSRISISAGYIFKHHSSISDDNIALKEYDEDAYMFVLGGDIRLSYRWKLAVEIINVAKIGSVPINLTARFLGKNYALELGFSFLGIKNINNNDSISFPLAPIVNFVWVF